MAELKVEVTFRCTVKPSSPTPPELRTHTLSWFDQFAPSNSVAFLLFYHHHHHHTTSSSTTLVTTINSLSTSLSHALTLFYPFAGRLQANSHVDCDDQGVDLLVAQVSSPLAPLLHRPHVDSLVRFLPSALADGALLAVQLTAFSCGGAAIGVRASHKVADAASLATFIFTWASATSDTHIHVDDLPRPLFDSATFFPPLSGIPADQNRQPVSDKERKLVTKRFLFAGEKIALLRGTPAAATRFEAVAALLWRCAARARGDARRASAAMILVDIRARMPPHGFIFGNLFTLAVSSAVVLDDNKDEKRRLEQELRSATRSIDAEYVGKLQGPKGVMMVAEKSKKVAEDYAKSGGDHGSIIDYYFFNSWLRLPLQDAEFGWGKPAWVGSAGGSLQERSVLLMEGDSCDQGMEVWVTLEEKEMVRFEQEKELTTFIASPAHVIA